MRRSVLIVALSLLILIAIAASITTLAARRTKQKAERLLSEVREIRVGDPNIESVKQIAARNGGRVLNADGCLTSTCQVKIRVTNDPLSRFYLAPWTGFSVSFFVKHGRTVHIGLELVSEVKGPIPVYGEEADFVSMASVEDDSQDSEYYDTRSGFKVIATRDLRNRPEKIIVHLTPTTDAATRDKVLRFNLKCLSKLGGCRNASQLLPAAWNEANAVAAK